jgi:hypothetical protein
MNGPDRVRTAEDLLRRLAGAVRGMQLYAPTHPIVGRGITAFADAVTVMHASAPSVTIGLVGEDLVVGGTPVPRAADTMGELIRRFQQSRIERIVIDRGVEPSELVALVQAMVHGEAGAATSPLGRLPHIRVGRLDVDRGVETSLRSRVSTTTPLRWRAGYGTAPASKARPMRTRPEAPSNRWRRRSRRTGRRCSH